MTQPISPMREDERTHDKPDNEGMVAVEENNYDTMPRLTTES